MCTAMTLERYLKKVLVFTAVGRNKCSVLPESRYPSPYLRLGKKFYFLSVKS